MGQYSKVEIDGRLMTVTINRPEVYNACHPMANEELVAAFDEFQANPDLWVAIITGAGDKAFCAGNDLKYHAELQAKTGKRPVHPLKGFGGLANRFDLDKPVIAAVNGVAMGGGFEIALACDIIIASDKATFALPEPKVGLAAGAGGMQRLSRMIPLKKAMGMMLTGRHVPAQGRLRAGLRHRRGAARRPHEGGAALGRRDPRLLADVGARHQAGGDALARRAGARGGDAQPALPRVRRHDAQRGHGRRAQGLRREAQAQLEGALRRAFTARPQGMRTTMNTGRLAASARAASLALMSVALMTAACTPNPPPSAATNTRGEPVNVGMAKLAAVEYHDSGDYMRDLAYAAAPANDWLRQRATQVSRPALVLDVDDTALTNWPVILANDFGRFPAGPCLLPEGPCGWHAWDLRGQDAPLEPTLQVFQTARSLGITVFFISGRPESERAATERNLRAAGYAGYEQAFFTPDGAQFTSLADFKAPTRQKIAAMGYAIIANMGDQMSDLDGGFAEKTFKLPNPFYYIP